MRPDPFRPQRNSIHDSNATGPTRRTRPAHALPALRDLPTQYCPHRGDYPAHDVAESVNATTLPSSTQFNATNRVKPPPGQTNPWRLASAVLCIPPLGDEPSRPSAMRLPYPGHVLPTPLLPLPPAMPAGLPIMSRPSIPEILAMVANTVHLQFANSDDGKRLIAADAPAVARMERRIANNIAAAVDGWLDEATGA